MTISLSDLVTPAISEAIRAHALTEYPKECVGVITPEGYRLMVNVSPEPETSGVWPQNELQELIASGDLRAMVHSHPNGPNCPSATDMRSQHAFNVPWVIVSTNGGACLPPFAFGDQMERPPLIGRGFQHGVTDCYSYIRDWYRVERGVELPQFVRDWDWWKLGDDLYTKGFASAGFTEAHDAPQRGDVLLYKVGSKVVNHGAIYEGGGVLSHHLATREPFDPNRLSTRDPAARWERFRVHHLRYGGHNE